jgi:hypothetical protein
VPRQSVIDIDGNIYTMGTFHDGQAWGCLPTIIQDGSFFLVKHASTSSPIMTIAGPSGQVCEGSSITLSTDLILGDALYKWFIPGGPDPGSGNIGQNAFVLNAPFDGDKQPVVVSVTDNCEEYFAEPFILDIAPLPGSPELVIGDSLVCPGRSEEFRINGLQDDNAYSWHLPAGVTASGMSDDGGILFFENGFTGGLVKVAASNACGATDLELAIQPYQTPGAPELLGNILVCPGLAQIQKEISPVEGAISYLWELPSFMTLDPLFPHEGTTLDATVSAQFESGDVRVRAVGVCQVSEPSSAITIARFATVQSAQPIVGPVEICAADNVSVRYAIPPIPNAEMYIWKVPAIFGNNGTVATSTAYIDLNVIKARTGIIQVYGVDQCHQEGGSSTLEIESFESLPTPIINLGECEQELVVSGKGEFEWFINGIPAPSLKGARQQPDGPGVYHVEVNNFCGIRQSDAVAVNPVVQSSVFIPNVITPDGDGRNDFFELDQSLKHSAVEISNRWGTQVYFSADYQNDWGAEGLATGNYFYVLRNPCLSHPYKGTLHILR